MKEKREGLKSNINRRVQTARPQETKLQEAKHQEAKHQEAEREMKRVRWALAQREIIPTDKLALLAMALDAGHGSGVTLGDCRQMAADIRWNPTEYG